MRLLISILALLLLPWPALPARAAEPERRALLVAISRYERGDSSRDWWNLNCQADAQAIRELLIRRFGFESDEITLLDSPEQTTRDAILRAFRERLIDGAGPDDVIYFHYSGHGSEMLDQNGDELDGLDECLVPSDYLSRDDASGNLRDDDLAALLAELAATGARNVTLSFDCCFSGTATRAGRTLLRGRAWSGPAPAGTRGGEDPEAGFVQPKEFVVLSATSQGQTAGGTTDSEGRSMGLFTHSLIRACGELGSEATYRDLYERIAGLMARETRTQTPQLEGKIDRLLFGAGIRPPTPYLSVSEDRGKLYLEAGSLQGQTAGSLFALYEAGVRDFAGVEPVTLARVERVDLNYAELTPLTPPADPSRLAGGRAVEREHDYGDGRIALHLSAELPAELREAVGRHPLVNAVDADAGWTLRLSADASGHRIERADGGLLGSVAPGGAAAGELIALIQGEARWRFLSELTNRDPYSQVAIELRLVAVEPEYDADGYVVGALRDLELPRTPSGRLQVAEGTHVMLELRNPGYVDAYVTVFDLRGDGSVGPLWPYPGLRVQDNRIPADGLWHRVQAPFIFALEGESGPETFKAIATAEPADFSPLVDPESLGERSAAGELGGGSPLERLLMSASLGERNQGGAVDAGNWATAAVEFELVERE